MFKWAIESEAHIQASARDVWNAWTDVSSWPKWDRELEWSSLEGPFEIGAVGKLKPKGWLKSTFCIATAEKERRFSDVTNLPMAKIVFNHFVAPWWDGKVRVVHRVEVSGFLAPLLRLTMGRRLRKELPKAMEKLTRFLEERKPSQ